MPEIPVSLKVQQSAGSRTLPDHLSISRAGYSVEIVYRYTAEAAHDFGCKPRLDTISRDFSPRARNGRISWGSGTSVASGRRFEPPDYCEKNQSIKKPRAFLPNTRLIIFYIIHQIIDEYGVPKGRPPYPPVTHDVSRNIFVLTFRGIRFIKAIDLARSSYSSQKQSTSLFTIRMPKKFRNLGSLVRSWQNNR